MEHGKEGDELLLFSLKSGLPANSLIQKISSLEEITAEVLVDTVVHALLVLQSTVKLDLDKDPFFAHIASGGCMPTNIASRHRICTAIAAKVKESGYLGDCGYNQLLYPVENQTRSLITWIAEKLSSVRTFEEGLVDVTNLSENAPLSKRIQFALKEWKEKPHLLPICLAGIPPRNIHFSRPFRTLSVNGSGTDYSSILKVFDDCKSQQIPADSSILERHALELIAESRLQQRNNSADKDSSAARVAAARRTKRIDSISPSDPPLSSADPPSQSDLSGGTNSEAGKGGLSLPELLRSIKAEAEQKANKPPLNTTQGRFSLVTAFAHESSATIQSIRDSPSVLTASKVSSQAGNDSDSSQSASAPQEDEAMTEAEKLRAAQKAQQEQEEAAQQRELDQLRALVGELTASIETTQQSLSFSQNRIRQLDLEVAVLNEEADSLEKEIVLKRKTLEMLPSANEHLAQLRGQCAQASEKIMQLAQEWEAVRRPLLEELWEKTRRRDSRRRSSSELLEDSKRLRAEIADMVQDLKEKQARSQELNEEIVKLPKNLNRLLYTHRIMDITASIAKQNVDIEKITDDIREIRKTINAHNSILQRADTVCEELVFAAANQSTTGSTGSASSSFLSNLKAAGLLSTSAPTPDDSSMVDTYRRLTTLRARFDELIATVGKIGVQEKAARDYETKIDQEKSRISVNNFQRIQSDLLAIREENAQLVDKIKALSDQPPHPPKAL